MLCDDVKRVVYFFLDGSLSEQKAHDLTVHLDRCPDCGARTTIHRRLRNFYVHRFRADSAPTHLKLRLTRSIRAIQTDL